MLISQNGDMEKADTKNTNKFSVDLNNVDAIKEKSNSLNAQKIKNINNLKQHNSPSCKEKNRNFCSDDLKKHISILFIILSLLTVIGATAVFCFITFTNKFNEGIVENLVLKNGTKSMEWWQKSPIQPLIKVYIFNYTNIEEYMRNPRGNKLKVHDAGPYVYREFGERVNLEFSEDHKITFNNKKRLEFVPELSAGTEDDLLVVPNIVLMAALQKQDTLNTVESLYLDGILRGVNPEEFPTRTVKEYLFGYTDSFISKLPTVDPEKTGLMSSSRGVSTDNTTVYTGEDSLDNLGRIHAMNGKTKLDIWDTDECNEIVGSDGSQFPPYMMDQEHDLKIFLKSFCITLTLRYEKEVVVLNGIPAWRYKMPEGAFDSSRKNPDHKCYCDAEKNPKCPPDGVFDVSKCLNDIPLMTSYPHFLEGDESLLEHFEGLKPDRKVHETYADIHPRMAFPIGGASRMQMNFLVKSKSIFFGPSWYTKLPRDLILPIVWFEISAGEIPPEFQSLVFHTTQSANATFLAIQYSSLITALVALILFVSISYFYCITLMRKPAEKVQNSDVILTFLPHTSKTPTAPPLYSSPNIAPVYPNLSTDCN